MKLRLLILFCLFGLTAFSQDPYWGLKFVLLNNKDTITSDDNNFTISLTKCDSAYNTSIRDCEKHAPREWEKTKMWYKEKTIWFSDYGVIYYSSFLITITNNTNNKTMNIFFVKNVDGMGTIKLKPIIFTKGYFNYKDTEIEELENESQER